jgi:REase_AHJR-like
MSIPDSLERLAEKYRREGFEVILHPTLNQIPSFFESTPPDFLARKGDRIIAIKHYDEATPEDEQIELDGKLGVESASLLIQEAELLLSPLTLRSALVMAWSAFEAAARTALRPGSTEFEAMPPRKMLDELIKKGLIGASEFNLLQMALYYRNLIAHGGFPEDFPPDWPAAVLTATRELLKSAGASSNLSLRDSVGVTIVRKAVNESKYKDLVERATTVLRYLLGPRADSVAIDWGLAEDARNHRMLVLRLSDATGSVSATFEPPELENERHLMDRLNRLWGDLLEIRSHNQVKRLQKPDITLSPFGPAA